MNDLEKTEDAMMMYMRGKYVADEMGDGENTLHFMIDGNKFLSVVKNADSFCVSICNTNAEVENFDIKNLDDWEAVKKVLLAKHKPNRKPFSEEGAIHSSCGHRCDLCVYYMASRVSDEAHYDKILKSFERVYGGEWDKNKIKPCDGCSTGGWHKRWDCETLKCVTANGVKDCRNCTSHPCEKAFTHYHGKNPKFHTKQFSADDVTLALLPYVPVQCW